MITNATSLTSGEVMRNEKDIPSGTRAFKNPIKSGIDEHEQKGVTAPNIAAAIFPIPKRDFCIRFLSDSSLKKVRINAIVETTKKIKIKTLSPS